MTLFSNLRILTASAGMAALAALASPSWAAPTIEKTVRVAPGGLYELVFNPTNNDVYVAATSGEAAIVRLDGATLAAEGSIPVTTDPVFGLALNNKTQTLYGSSTRRGVVAIIDAATGQIQATLKHGEDGGHVRQIVIDENHNKAYVSVVGGDSAAADANPNEIWVIDGATRTLEKVYTVKANRMAGLGIDPVAERLFVTSMNDDLIIAIDAKTGAEIGRWASGGDVPINVLADNASKRLFVTNQGDGVLTVLNSETGALLAKVATGSGALGVAYNPKLNQAYVSNRNAGTTTVVNAADYSVVANLETGTLPQTVTIDHATGLVYVSNKARGGRVQPGAPPPLADERGDTVAVIRP